MKLAEALLRRKELDAKVKLLSTLKVEKLFHPILQRKPAAEGYDDIIGQVPKLTASQVTAEYDAYARKLRLVDAAIQQANWTTEMPTLTEDVMADYVQPKD